MVDDSQMLDARCWMLVINECELICWSNIYQLTSLTDIYHLTSLTNIQHLASSI